MTGTFFVIVALVALVALGAYFYFPYLQDNFGYMALCTVANWSFNFAISFTFLSRVEAPGRGNAFWLYVGIAVLAFLFFLTQVPETKDQSLEEIEQELGADTDTVTPPGDGTRTAPRPRRPTLTES